MPPGGKTLCDLIYELGVYFCNRTKQVGPPPGFVDQKLAEYRAKKAQVQHGGQGTHPGNTPGGYNYPGNGGPSQRRGANNPPIPQPGGNQNHGRGGYQGNNNNNNNNNNRGYGGKGGGYQGRGGGKGGGGYQGNNNRSRN